MIKILLVEDNLSLRGALATGLESTLKIQVTEVTSSGEEACQLASEHEPDAILMDVALAGQMNGIQAAIAIRKEIPRLPVVFYSIQDDDTYYRDFINSGILSHYAYVRKSNYLLPEMIVPLIRQAIAGSSFVDPEIAVRVSEVRHKDANDPLALLEPNEQAVVELLAQGLSNEQIAARLGYHDARAVSRTNGQIYTAWGLNNNAIEEKVARTRAVLIYIRRQVLIWDVDGRFEIAP
jgi:DNA-binding NarL/FixJ family response regulator